MKNKKLIKIMIGVSLVVVMAIAIPLTTGCTSQAPTPEPTPTPTPGEPTPAPTPEPAQDLPIYTWRITSPFGAPDTEEDMRLNYADILNEMSGGRIEATVYEPGELVPEGEVVAAVRSGTIDIGWWYSTAGAETLFRDIECGMPFESACPPEMQSLITRRGLGELIADSYADIGVHYIRNAMTDPFNVIATKPITGYSDFQGLKMNATGPMAPPFVGAGCSTVVFPVEEFYLTGQTGVVDALFWAGATEYTGMKLYEVYPYIVMPCLVDCCNSSILMNQELWDSLPSDIQAIVTCATEHMSEHCYIKRFNGQSTDIKNWEHIITLDDESIQKLYEHELDEWYRLATLDARNAQGIQILLEYQLELEEMNWTHRAYSLDTQPIKDLLERVKAL
ncbi:MAG: TRAP transporter substrate-binding protein DctP [Dehalococcoidales bacterium]|nr:TRAP transporter substrate-binding protein DctP [Dehalococcoidales bacterium]